MRLLAALPACLLGLGAAHASDLTLRRVMLSSAGVGYYEFEAAVSAPATLGLDVKLDQVDDLLKSLVVFDSQGGVGAVELPGRDENRTAFGQVPFGPEGLASPLAYLNALQGIELIVDGPRPMRGRLLRAETVRDTAPGPGLEGTPRTRVTLITETGLQQFVLEDSTSVQVADEALRARIGHALATLRRQSADDVRHLTIASLGAGERSVRVSYVTVAPLWKASYRVLLPAEDAAPGTAKARLQGWATLENTTGNDWSQVALALQYGNPVTFHQAIYRSYFVTRPEVPVEILGRLLPNVDTRARPTPPPPPSPAMVGALAPPTQFAARGIRPGAAPAPAPPPVMADASDAATSQEAATETVFTIAHPVDLPAGHSATVPILDQNVPAERVDLLTQDQPHPVANLRLVNNTNTSLPAGVLTLYDPAADAPYAGDARLGGVPAGESRLIGYAQDLRVSAEWRHEEQSALASLKAADGVLETDTRNRQITHVVLTGAATAPRHILVEFPKAEGATVAPGFAKPQEETAESWRFALDLKPGETRELIVALDTHDRESVRIIDEQDAVAAVLDLQGVSPAARTALAGITRLRQAEATRQADKDRLTEDRKNVEADETRVRANLGALQTADALRARLLKQLEADEDRLAQLDTALQQADDAVRAAHRDLVNAVSTLKI